MGFRDIESFNVAMLAKQGWRFLQNPSSLVARIYRDKYFRNSMFLKAKIGQNPSFIWRSVLSARDLLKEGLQWRVGNGKDIKIWGEKWLPTPTSKCVQSPVNMLWEEERVHRLIDVHTKTWDEKLIRVLFSVEEAETILRIPLSRMGAVDKQIWGYTKDGLFSVRSAYHLQTNLKRRRKGEASRSDQWTAVWKSIWALEVPAVVKLFLWKSANDILPTNSNLFKKKVEECPLCPICKRHEESVMHILWSCPSTVDVWADSISPVQKWVTDEDDFLILWVKLMTRLKKEELEWMATTMRKIWLRRNSLLFNNKFYSPKSLIQMASEGLEEYKAAQLIPISMIVSGGVDGSKKKWQRPYPGVVKANWDASLDLHAKKMGVGICIRDEEGEVLVSACDVKTHVDNPALAECMALWKALVICKELALSKVYFEGDAAAVINAIRKDGEDQSWMGHIIEDIKLIITEREDWTVNFVPREGNIVAHLLAKHALDLGEERVWIEEGPYVICNALLHDKFCNVHS